VSHPLDNLGDDIRDHIERETQENIERGMPPEEARAAARRKFGNITRVMEETRAVWMCGWSNSCKTPVTVSVGCAAIPALPR
jgi:hypothetical protein